MNHDLIARERRKRAKPWTIEFYSDGSIPLRGERRARPGWRRVFKPGHGHFATLQEVFTAAKQEMEWRDRILHQFPEAKRGPYRLKNRTTGATILLTL